jgi:hypothetical protein
MSEMSNYSEQARVNREARIKRNTEADEYETKRKSTLVNAFELKFEFWESLRRGRLKEFMIAWGKVQATKPRFIDINATADFDTTDCGGCTPLSVAIRAKNHGLVEYLIDTCGADVNVPIGPFSEFGQTNFYQYPLHVAVEIARSTSPLDCDGIVMTLLDRGADVKRKDTLGRNAFHYMFLSSLDDTEGVLSCETLNVLMDYSPDQSTLSIEDKFGYTPIDIAIRKYTPTDSNLLALGTLVRSGVDLNTSEGALLSVVKNMKSCPESVKTWFPVVIMLLTHGADPFLADRKGFTPMKTVLSISSQKHKRKLTNTIIAIFEAVDNASKASKASQTIRNLRGGNGNLFHAYRPDQDNIEQMIPAASLQRSWDYLHNDVRNMDIKSIVETVLGHHHHD